MSAISSCSYFLQRFHIGGTVLRWFSNYLTGRSRRVVVNDQAWDEFICTKGRKQCAGGPLLFNLYVATCILLQPDKMSLCQRLLMTGHSTVRGRQWSMRAVTSPRHWQASQVSWKAGGSQSTAKRLLQWLSNPRSSKTSVVTSIDITCGRTTIPLVDSTHMLGVIIDSNLSWKEYVDHVCLKVNRTIGSLRRSFRQLSPVARRLFYLSIIQPDFDFGSSAFIPNILMSQWKRLVATSRRAVIAVAGSGYQEDVGPLLKELMIDQIEHRWAQHVAVTTFRCRHGTAPLWS